MTLATSLQEKPLNTTQTHYIIKEEFNNYNHRNYEKARVNLLKRLPLQKMMDLKVDYAFKQLFGTEKNKQITIVFLNAILQKTGRDQIKDISFANIEAGGEFSEDKRSRLDLLVVTDAGEKINVEIQFTDKYDFLQRSIYYWSGVYRSSFKTGMDYDELNPAISINIMNYNIFEQTDSFHTMFHLYEDEEMFKLTDLMEFHFLEMPKLMDTWKKDKLDPWNDILARWLLLLGMVDHRNKKVYEEIYHELEGIAMNDRELQKAFYSWEEISMTEEQYLAYEARLKFINDEEAHKRKMEKKQEKIDRGKEEIAKGKVEIDKGKEEIARGKAKIDKSRIEIKQDKQEIYKREDELKKNQRKFEESGMLSARRDVAKSLLTAGTDIDTVIEHTDLPKEVVLEISEGLQK